MADTGLLWAVFTIVAAFAQTIRNATQRELSESLGTAGATHVRFLFGFPFAVFFFATVSVRGLTLPSADFVFLAWVLLGALAQVGATALMLAAMRERAFVVAIALIKTEPVQVAVFGLVFLGDPLTPAMAAAILIATFGVVVMSLRSAQDANSARPMLLGLAAGGLFALSAVGYRGAILSLGHSNFVVAATFTLTIGLGVQAGLLSLQLAFRDRAVLRAILRAWRPSILAGFMGAVASQFWFLAFALTTAANVRTLALVEVLFAQAIAYFAFGQRITGREALGIVLVVSGVALLLWAN